MFNDSENMVCKYPRTELDSLNRRITVQKMIITNEQNTLKILNKKRDDLIATLQIQSDRKEDI